MVQLCSLGLTSFLEENKQACHFHKTSFVGNGIFDVDKQAESSQNHRMTESSG